VVIGVCLAAGWFIFPFAIRRISETRLARLGWWTIDSKDPQDSSKRRRIGDILDEIATNGGGVLMQGFDKAPDPGGGMPLDGYVAGLTRQIIEFAEENGSRLLRLRDVLRKAQG